LATVTPTQNAAVLERFARFMRGARGVGVDDRVLAEWLLSVSVRWLNAHGYSQTSLHQWVQHELERPGPAPLTAAAAAHKDFGERR
jgi:hypothetical protein